ncbi:MAG: type II toxin-antitoxin system VapC family toxin [Chitinophagaceae bacterium]|nr:type II toxin-antitoxin system VapC family toxin [Chitinophagaceae bacterium]
MEMNMLVDSNVIIDYVSNRIPEKSANQLDIYFNSCFSVSIITKIEVLGFNTQEYELEQLESFIQLSSIVYIDEVVTDKTIEIRRMKRIKLPDAIIAATAIVKNCILLSHNTTDFKKIEGLQVWDPYSFIGK